MMMLNFSFYDIICRWIPLTSRRFGLSDSLGTVCTTTRNIIDVLGSMNTTWGNKNFCSAISVSSHTKHDAWISLLLVQRIEMEVNQVALECSLSVSIELRWALQFTEEFLWANEMIKWASFICKFGYGFFDILITFGVHFQIFLANL